MDKKQWTLMFYFASDNPLAPSIVSQLKAIKDAGFHPEANVIAHFDPHVKGMPSHTFEINLLNKLKYPEKSRVGFTPNDPYVRTLTFDKLWGEGDEEVRNGIQDFFNNNGGSGDLSKDNKNSYNPPAPRKELSFESSPQAALDEFLKFCRKAYPAYHYMLFILGHGLVVGNDLFLYDENTLEPSSKKLTKRKAASDEDPPPAQRSLLLKGLGDVLRSFEGNIGKDSQLELVGFHSCSMSALEVAYEIQGYSNYMLASQGPAFVGSWPYRHILIGVLNDLKSSLRREENICSPTTISKLDVRKTLERIFDYSVYNSHDYLLAGYSYDMCLCNLNKLKDKKKGIKTPLQKLSSALENALDDPLMKEPMKELILLAHWDAQSYWQEQYTDLYDFCLRLYSRCEPYAESTSTIVQNVRDACRRVMEVLKIDVEDDDRLIVRSEFVGPEYQYSHGLSVFFPWSEPVDDFLKKQYEKYELSSDTSWNKFLDKYLTDTRRRIRYDEKDPVAKPASKKTALKETDIEQRILDLIKVISTRVYNGQLSKGGSTDSTDKGGSGDASGDDCSCPSIKNYPLLTREICERRPLVAKDEFEAEGVEDWSTISRRMALERISVAAPAQCEVISRNLAAEFVNQLKKQMKVP